MFAARLSVIPRSRYSSSRHFNTEHRSNPQRWRSELRRWGAERRALV